MDAGQIGLVLLTGLQVGAVYVLIALGLTLIFGTLGMVNFAHGALFMVGAYAAWFLSQHHSYWSRSRPRPSCSSSSASSSNGG